MSSTTNIGLQKFGVDERISINAINNNWTNIDTAYGSLFGTKVLVRPSDLTVTGTTPTDVIAFNVEGGKTYLVEGVLDLVSTDSPVFQFDYSDGAFENTAASVGYVALTNSGLPGNVVNSTTQVALGVSSGRGSKFLYFIKSDTPGVVSIQISSLSVDGVVTVAGSSYAAVQQWEVTRAPTTPPDDELLGGWSAFETAYVYGTEAGDTSSVAHGREMNDVNTGIHANGLYPTDLTRKGATTYSDDGATIENMHFTGTVVIAGNNITIRNCLFTSFGAEQFMLKIIGNDALVEFCTIIPSPGHSSYEGIFVSDYSQNAVISRCNVSTCENNITMAYMTQNVEITECYLHGVSILDNPEGHTDVIEIYGGLGVNINKSKIIMAPGQTTPINCAPWGDNDNSVEDFQLTDNYIDGGIFITLFDLQSTSGHIWRVSVLRNDFGGHTESYGYYWACHNKQHMPFVETEAEMIATPVSIWWPTTGSDVNHWVDSHDLVPDKSGEIIIPGDEF